MDAYNLIKELIDFKNEDRTNLPLLLTKLECKILMEEYYKRKLKLLGMDDVAHGQLLALAEYICQHYNTLDGKTAKDYLQDFLK